MRVLYMDAVQGDDISGAERVMLQLIQKLDPDIYQPHVILSGEGVMAERVRRLGIEPAFIPMEPFFKPRLRPAMLWRYGRRLVSAAWAIARYVRRHRIRLIHTHNEGAHFAGGLAGRLSGTRVVLHMHDVKGEPEEGLARSLYTLLALACASRIILVSAALERTFLAHEPIRARLRRKISICHNGIELHRFRLKAREAAIVEELGLDSCYPVVGIIGHLAPRKGQRDFILAAARVIQEFPQARFLIVGRPMFEAASRDYEAGLRALVKERGLESYVTFTGQRDDVPQILSALDIVVSASYAEPFALSLLEAMAAGRAIVATAVDGTPEMLGQAGVLVPPGDPHALAEAIMGLARDRDALERLGSAALARVQARFSLDAFVHDVAAAYQAVLT